MNDPIERWASYTKGLGHEKRVRILLDIEAKGSLSLRDLAALRRINVKTACDHVYRLHRSKLISKTRHKKEILHQLTPLATRFLSFLRNTNSF